MATKRRKYRRNRRNRSEVADLEPPNSTVAIVVDESRALDFGHIRDPLPVPNLRLVVLQGAVRRCAPQECDDRGPVQPLALERLCAWVRIEEHLAPLQPHDARQLLQDAPVMDQVQLPWEGHLPHIRLPNGEVPHATQLGCRHGVHVRHHLHVAQVRSRRRQPIVVLLAPVVSQGTRSHSIASSAPRRRCHVHRHLLARRRSRAGAKGAAGARRAAGRSTDGLPIGRHSACIDEVAIADREQLADCSAPSDEANRGGAGGFHVALLEGPLGGLQGPA
mmetsp:Transcript_55101/g.154662  ORF Transcript_55101/g.154662 Transcript_55101/m.154662 type:complete len:277 (+) Transcript_55101:28-858(+)